MAPGSPPFQSFFELHDLPEEYWSPDPLAERLMWSCEPAFYLEVKVVNQREYCFVPSFREVEDMCVAVLETFVTAVSVTPPKQTLS